MQMMELNMEWIADVDGRLPGYKGGLLRGAMGYALRQRFCMQDFNNSCKRCENRPQCQYALFFEPMATDSASGEVLAGSGFTDAARPFVFEIQDFRRHFKVGDRFKFSLRLLGMELAILQVIADVFTDMSEMGLGKSRIPGSFSINNVKLSHKHDLHPLVSANRISLRDALEPLQSTLFTNPQSLTLRFLTWTVLKANGSVLHHFEKDVFAKAVLRRFRQLIALYGEENEYSLFMNDYDKLLQAWRHVVVGYDHTEFRKWGRTSTRQRQTYEVEGFTGTVKLQHVPTVWIPFLEWSEWLHVGKGATFGLGAMRIQQMGSKQHQHESFLDNIT